ncbi:MAG: RraA family protein [Rhodospirillales bacterium]|nr:RraA family protein [Rhodospirillales bacterium]
MSIGFRILPVASRVAPAVVEAFRALPVANVSDSMSRMSAGGARLRPYYSGPTMAGPALTVKTRPGDNLMVHKALDIAIAGDVVVVDAGGDLTSAIIGELMQAHARTRRLGGIVINGAIRDVAALRASDFPVFAAGVTHRGPYKDGPGEIGVPVAIEGMVIAPGDLMLGDEDGVLCVPAAEAEAVLAATRAKHAAEEKQLAATLAGTTDRTWIDATLRKLGVM